VGAYASSHFCLVGRSNECQINKLPSKLETRISADYLRRLRDVFVLPPGSVKVNRDRVVKGASCLFGGSSRPNHKRV